MRYRVALFSYIWAKSKLFCFEYVEQAYEASFNELSDDYMCECCKKGPDENSFL